jgi:hypothetical protein
MLRIRRRNPVIVSGRRLRQVPVGSGKSWINPITGSVHWNTASMKSPKYHGTSRFLAGLFDLGVSRIVLPRSIRRGRKRLFLIVFDSFGGDRITVVFHRIVNEHKRSDTPFSGRLRQLLTVYDTTKNGRNTITTKCPIYSP